MLLAWAVPCDSYELHEDGTADIFVAGLDTFYVEELPADLRLTILIQVQLLEDEHAEIDVTMLAPEPTPVGTLTFAFDAEPGQNHRPGYLVNQIEPLQLDFVAETAGVYSVEIFVNRAGGTVSEAHRRSIYFSVREGLPS